MTRKNFGIIFGLAAILRIAYIATPPLWYDENFTYILARLPFERMISATAGDVHPPLFYILNWLLFSPASNQAPWMIRVPSLIFSLAALYTFDRLCEQLIIPRRARFVATVLMALMPFQIWYAQEGRMYALLEWLVLLTLLYGLRRNWIGFTLAATAMLYTQNYGVIYLAVIVGMLTVRQFEDAVSLITSASLAGFAFAPWAFVVQSQMAEIDGRYWITDAGPGAALGAVYKLFWTSSMMPPAIIGSYVVTFAALIAGAWAVLGDKARAWWVVLIMAWAPIAIAMIASYMWQPILLFRPLIGASPFLYLTAAWNAERKITARGILYAACIILPVFGFGIGGYYKQIAEIKNPGSVSSMHAAMTTVREQWREGDVLFFADDGPMINVLPYASDLPMYKMPTCDQEVTGYAPVLGSLSNSTRAAIGVPVIDLRDVPHTRAWVFAPRSPLHPECYEDQIARIAPEGLQLITVDDNQFITSGVWLITNQQAGE